MLFDGILFSPLVTKAELLDMNSRTSMPLVLLGEHDFDGRYDHVAIDNVRAAHDATRALLTLDPRPDAIFCYSDLLAMGAMRAVFDAGLSVPEDVAIIGIDDIEEGRYSRPTLTTVSLDTPFIAHHAVARIVARIDEPDVAAEEVIAPHQVLARESTARSAG